jgi:hypothetical protein
MEPKDILCFPNGTWGEDMGQKGRFINTTRLLRIEERSHLLDSLWVRNGDRNYDKAHFFRETGANLTS